MSVSYLNIKVLVMRFNLRSFSPRSVFTLLLFFSVLSACVEKISVDSTDINGMAGSMVNGGSVYEEDQTELLTNSTFMIRVLPADTSLGAEIFCTGVALQPKIAITSASCFRAGVRYAEILGGPDISFFNNNPRLGVVTEVYSHRAYEFGAPVNNGADLAIVHVDQQLVVPIVQPYVGDFSDIQTNLYRIGYSPNEDLEFRRQVSFGLNPAVAEDVLLFSQMPSDNEPCLIQGGPVLALIDNQPSLIAVSSRGNESCTVGGNASLLTNSISFLNDAAMKVYQLKDGQQAQVQGGLNCSEAFKCYELAACLTYLTQTAQEELTALFSCAQEGGCNQQDCYQSTCPELFDACIGL